MNIGVIGLGRMGCAIATRLKEYGHTVIGYDNNVTLCKKVQEEGIACVGSYAEVATNVEIIWLMVPAGHIVDTVLAEIYPYMQQKSVIIDGGNSHFSDSVRRANMLREHHIFFLDCGTSGGLQGKEIGYSLMIGGERIAYEYVEPIFKALAMPNGYAYMGPSGAGHYVKMVHNGIEYALLQAYAEGFQVLKEGRYKHLDLEKITQVWLHGSIIRSWILELTKNIFEHDQEFTTISGEVGGGQTGQWIVNEAHEQHIPVGLIEKALDIRKVSHKTGGNFATKLVALLRNEFGGHEVLKRDDDH